MFDILIYFKYFYFLYLFIVNQKFVNLMRFTFFPIDYYIFLMLFDYIILSDLDL